MRIAPYVVFLLVGVGTQGQSQLATEALGLLDASRSPVEQAWGAYLCGSLAVEACKPPLIKALEAWDSRLGGGPAVPDSPEYFQVQSIMDALIRVRAMVPSQVALRFRAGWRDEAFLLFLLSNPTEDMLLALPESELTSPEWIAVSNALLNRGSAAFFLRMAQSKRFEHHFSVYDIEREYGTAGGIGDGIYTPPAIRKVPAEYPPVGVYELKANGRSGDTLVSSGPCASYQNIAYSRMEITPAGTPLRPNRPFIGHPPIYCRDAYLAAFRGMQEADARPILRPSTDVRWSSPSEFRKQTEAAMERSATALRQFLADGLIGHLTYGKEIPITVTPVVTDLRENQKVPLPAVAPKTFVLN
ncbi:hypothetical protein F183_A09170 [Bryobacterales bacterium F-183]|nr:hypothetical protein F183_A09170 [Bryobacterales bacterium F-183]